MHALLNHLNVYRVLHDTVGRKTPKLYCPHKKKKHEDFLVPSTGSKLVRFVLEKIADTNLIYVPTLTMFFK